MHASADNNSLRNSSVAGLDVNIDERKLAEIVGFSVWTVRRWRSENRGPRYRKIGGGPKAPVRYSVADVQQWLERQPVSGPPVVA